MTSESSRGRLSLAWVLVLVLMMIGSVSKADTIKADGPESPDARVEGPVSLPLGDVAQMRLPEGYVWSGNRTYCEPERLGDVRPLILGSFRPKGVDERWFADVVYYETGFVRDNGALNADEILRAFNSSNDKDWPLRFGDSELRGWSMSPSYDAAHHRIEYGIHAVWTSVDSPDELIFFHHLKLLGRGGVLDVKVHGPQAEMASAMRQVRAICGEIVFNPGTRYSDYREGDKVAAVGLQGVVIGGAAGAQARAEWIDLLYRSLRPVALWFAVLLVAFLVAGLIAGDRFRQAVSSHGIHVPVWGQGWALTRRNGSDWRARMVALMGYVPPFGRTVRCGSIPFEATRDCVRLRGESLASDWSSLVDEQSGRMRSFLKQLEADGRGLVERTYWTKVLSGWAALSEEMRDVVMRRWLEARFDPKSARHYCGEIRRSIRGVRIFGALQWVLVVVVLPLMIKGPYYARDEFGLGFLMLFLFVFVLPGLLGLHVCQCVLAIDAFGKIHSFPMSKWERFRLAISPLHAMRASGYLMLTAGVVFDEMAWLLAVDAADDAMELARERQRTNEFGGGMPSSVLASWSAELRQMNERILNKAGVRSEDLAMADGNTPKLSQYCPKCRGLFAGSMQTCAECGVPLKHLSKRQVLDVRNVITRISRRTKRD